MKYVMLVCLSMMLASCAHQKEELNESFASAEELYEKGQEALASTDYPEAATYFQKLDREFPYSLLAPKAQTMEAYALFENGDYEDAIAAAERFLLLHPYHAEVSYMYYLMAMCYYERIADVRRDQDQTLKAQKAFETLITRFPQSPYVRDATLKLDLINDHLAGKEMTIGRFYLNQGTIVSAISRFQTVVEKYSTTTHTPEALFRLCEVYMTLGVESEARKYAAVLGHNYPESKWYKRAYALMKGQFSIPTTTFEKLRSVIQ